MITILFKHFENKWLRMHNTEENIDLHIYVLGLMIDCTKIFIIVWLVVILCKHWTHFLNLLESGAAICTYFLTSVCNKGSSCPFRHIKGDRTVVCKHWLRGLCKKGDDCEFLHEFDMSKMPECFFFSKFGKRLWFWCCLYDMQQFCYYKQHEILMMFLVMKSRTVKLIHKTSFDFISLIYTTFISDSDSDMCN